MTVVIEGTNIEDHTNILGCLEWISPNLMVNILGCGKKCEKYFRMCIVPQDLWAPFATLHFHGHAAYWLQTFEAQHTNYNWVELCVVVETKFGKEMYHNYMRDLFSHQTI
jgi:hypothetical protein